MDIPPLVDKARPARVTLRERSLLTQPTSSKKTYHLSLDVQGSGVHFSPGDSIGIFAQNDPTLVERLIAAMDASGEETVVDPRSATPMSLRTFLHTKANLARSSSSLLKLLYAYEPQHDKKNALRHLLDPDNRPTLTQLLATHDPLDLLKTYGNTQVPLQELLSQFSPMLPRFYSAASSQRAHPHHVDLTVALFTLTHAGEPRHGVASHFLCHLAEVNKTEIPIYVQPAHGFALPEDPHAPIIMVGPGTGVAPFRAFLQERIACGAPGKNWLFFGERNRASDYFYKEFLEALRSEDKLRLTLAFSRDQEHKIYVQHRMHEQAKDLWAWLQEGAYFFVCGDAHRMAKDVEAMLIQIAREQGFLSDDNAKAYVKSLRTSKRYLTDVY